MKRKNKDSKELRRAVRNKLMPVEVVRVSRNDRKKKIKEGVSPI